MFFFFFFLSKCSNWGGKKASGKGNHCIRLVYTGGMRVSGSLGWALWLLYAQKRTCLEVALGSKANSFLEALRAPCFAFASLLLGDGSHTAWGVRCCSQPAPRCSSVMHGDKHAVKRLNWNIHQRCARPRESCRWSFFFFFFFCQLFERPMNFSVLQKQKH